MAQHRGQLSQIYEKQGCLDEGENDDGGFRE